MTILGVNGVRLATIRSGVARYIENVLRVWEESEIPFERVIVYTPRPIDPLPFPAVRTETRLVPARGSLALWEQLRLPRAHGREAPLFCPSYIAPLLARCPIALVHHGSYEGYPAAFPWWRRWKAFAAYRASARRADLLITVSESSRRDMARYYGLAPERIHVVPVGVDTALFHPLADPALLADFRRRVLGVDAPFLLYVGKPIRRHNVRPMLEGFKLLVERGRTDHRFLFIGADLPGLDVRSIVRELGLEARVTLVGHAGHDTIRLAYNAAALFVYPSDYEGFGMPVLEAMACGTPIVALDNTAIPEFAGGVALLLPKGDAESLAAAYREVLGDEGLRRRMRELGPLRARDYEWRGVAGRTMDLLSTLAAGGPP
jgi:glycosyltransferase involved in cell wall biosynthesis